MDELLEVMETVGEELRSLFGEIGDAGEVVDACLDEEDLGLEGADVVGEASENLGRGLAVDASVDPGEGGLVGLGTCLPPLVGAGVAEEDELWLRWLRGGRG